VSAWPASGNTWRACRARSASRAGGKPKRSPKDLYDLLPSDHRMSYDVRAVLDCVLDAGKLDEFQPDLAPEMICAHGAIEGRTVALIANSRGVIKGRKSEGGAPKIGGIIYTESAEKVAYFIENGDRERIPLLFVQDVSGSWSAPKRSTRGSFVRGALRGSDGDRNRSEACAHREPCLGSGLLWRWQGRASIPTSSSRGRPEGWESWKVSRRSKRSRE